MSAPAGSGPGVHVLREGPVATVVIDRADKHNAVTPALDAAVAAALHGLAGDDAVRVVILTGAGTQAFCTGADIPTLFPALREQVRRSDEPINFCGLTHGHPLPGKPVIAAVNGLALGGGFELALASDLRIAASSARFGLPEPRWGVVAGAGGCARVLQALPPAVAAEVLLAGRQLTADEALHWGLVSRVVPPEALAATARQVALRIAEASPPAIRGLVDFWRAQRQRQDREALLEERALFGALIGSPAAEAGIAAFTARHAGSTAP